MNHWNFKTLRRAFIEHCTLPLKWRNISLWPHPWCQLFKEKKMSCFFLKTAGGETEFQMSFTWHRTKAWLLSGFWLRISLHSTVPDPEIEKQIWSQKRSIEGEICSVFSWDECYFWENPDRKSLRPFEKCERTLAPFYFVDRKGMWRSREALLNVRWWWLVPSLLTATCGVFFNIFGSLSSYNDPCYNEIFSVFFPVSSDQQVVFSKLWVFFL